MKTEEPPEFGKTLTAPCEPVGNGGCDNADCNLICKVGDEIKGSGIFTVKSLLGTGTFGQVFQCQIQNSSQCVAIKVIRNKTAYRNQGLLEISIITALNTTHDPSNRRNIVRMLESFEHKDHICIVFELLGGSLLDVLSQNQFRGLPLLSVQRYTYQLLTALSLLEEAQIIHCDLKPENILVCQKDGPQSISKPSANSNIKLIDFGSACYEKKTMYTYIQSRFYRSPEVLIGHSYTTRIDMWSLACVCTEMYLGLPLFPGISAHNQLVRIIDMFGMPPDYIVEYGKYGSKFFKKFPVAPQETIGEPQPFADKKEAKSGFFSPRSSGKSVVRDGSSSTILGSISNLFTGKRKSSKERKNSTDEIPSSDLDSGDQADCSSRSISSNAPVTPPRVSSKRAGPKFLFKGTEEFAQDTNTPVPTLKKYLRYSTLQEVILKCPLAGKSMMSHQQKIQEMDRRQLFLDFLSKLFVMDPALRMTAAEALNHPFITSCPQQHVTIPTEIASPTPAIHRVINGMDSIQQKTKEDAAPSLYTGNGEKFLLQVASLPYLSPDKAISKPTKGLVRTREAEYSREPSMSHALPPLTQSCTHGELNVPALALSNSADVPSNGSNILRRSSHLDKSQISKSDEEVVVPNTRHSITMKSGSMKEPPITINTSMKQRYPRHADHSYVSASSSALSTGQNTARISNSALKQNLLPSNLGSSKSNRSCGTSSSGQSDSSIDEVLNGKTKELLIDTAVKFGSPTVKSLNHKGGNFGPDHSPAGQHYSPLGGSLGGFVYLGAQGQSVSVSDKHGMKSCAPQVVSDLGQALTRANRERSESQFNEAERPSRIRGVPSAANAYPLASSYSEGAPSLWQANNSANNSGAMQPHPPLEGACANDMNTLQGQFSPPTGKYPSQLSSILCDKAEKADASSSAISTAHSVSSIAVLSTLYSEDADEPSANRDQIPDGADSSPENIPVISTTNDSDFFFQVDE